MKRSVWCIVEADPPPVQCKRTRKSYKTVKAKKCRQQKTHAVKKPKIHAVKQSSVYDEAEQSIFIQDTKLSASKRRRANTPAGNEPRDSGVHSESSSSGSCGGCSGSSGSSSGSFAGGSGSTGGSGKQGNSGGDDGDKKKEFPQWHLPGQQDNAAKKTGKKKGAKQDDEEKGYAGEEKMEVDYVPGTNATGFPLFLPSKVDNAEQCHSPGEGKPTTTSGKVAYL